MVDNKIFCSNASSKEALSTLMLRIKSKVSSSYSIAIFNLGNDDLDEMTLTMLLRCNSERVLILASDRVLRILSAILPGSIFLFVSYKISLLSLTKIIKLLMISPKINPGSCSAVHLYNNALTYTERVVLTHFIKGRSSEQISHMINYSKDDVETLISSSLKKLGVFNHNMLAHLGILLKIV
ncbi:helix-turn-helix transcriptional regulator [Klebsiella aerogenes]|uniref:helix-turn-helix transcriptional regulator n=1 Tax=Klebsiella aerogenes TaxID=548 RepID=UPI00254E753E|nr:LuxR C-terminal-related transcriptional regulator [Klebsiella aerogenes]MDK7100069.1 LuxR C-terminal-related transcriptional regulator [Klebsiella aerogenes]MDK7645560.1 LuxR C-terminal-related transcriptional regulator [Klebsiella aerogenes]MDK7850441.1 LuxR C-terminal-related transcriptional regulator [Klebsiella aerogenes]MDK8313050.1 LuxR C-terminal-related transcriptional regulator [Klebsiella aerogenes]